MELGKRLTLSEIIELNIRKTISEFCESNKVSFEVQIDITDSGSNYTNMGYGNRVVIPRTEHFLTIRLIEK